MADPIRKFTLREAILLLGTKRAAQFMQVSHKRCKRFWRRNLQQYGRRKR